MIFTKRYRAVLFIALFCLFVPAFSKDTVLTLAGELKQPMVLSQKDFAGFPRHTVKGIDHDGKQNEYEGSALFDILVRGGVPLGDSLRGKKLMRYLQAEAADGYNVVYALPEIDTSFTDKLILVADKENGKPLNEKEGHLQIIVPGEKKHARWIRQLKTLKIMRSAG